MKSAKKARLLSIFLATALVIGSLPSALGIIASADGTAIDYSAVVNQTHLKINDYYSNLNMYDGVGLEVSNGTVVTDKDWYSQLANGDADVKVSGAYAVYNILPGSAFSADFTDTTAIGKMKIYFSEDMVDWFLADTVVAEKTLTVAKTPDYAKYAKIQWPTSSSEKNGLKSVTLTSGERDAADKRVDYAVNALDGAVQNGIDSDSYLVKYGIWNTSDNLYYFDSGIIQPDYSGIEGTTDENPFDGYVIYKAQPGTHFGLTVTSDRLTSQFAELLGKAPLDWKVEIYGSLDGVNYKALNIDPVYSARYSNSFDPEDPDNGTRRSADYNFIVPDDVVFIKCKFPQTKDLSSLNEDEIAGNDLFEINKVEFTQLEYDYCKLSDDDYYITDGTGGTVPASAYSKLGISDTNGDFQRLTDEASRCLIDPTWGQQYYNKGKSRATVIYAVEPGTPFYLGFKSIGSRELNKYIKDFATISGGKFTLIISGRDSETEVMSQIGEITITVENSEVQFFTFALTAEENKYSEISVRWPELLDDTCAGNSILGIAEAYLTLPSATTVTEKTDFTKVSGYGGVNSKNDFVGAVDWSKGHVPYIDGNGIGGDWSYLDGHADAGEKPYVTWEVEGGQKVSFSFATQGSKYIDFYGSNIKVYTSATLDFAESSEYSLVNAEGNAYVCTLTVPENHKYVKVVLPQDRKYNSGDAANQAFLIKSMTKEVLPIQKTDFTKVSGYGGVNSKNDFVGAVDWSKGHVPYIDGNGIGGDWSYLDGHADAGEKPYVTWEVEGGQKVSFSFATQGSKYIDFYGSNIKVYTSATLDFAESSEYSLVNAEGNAYVCNLTVPENHKYVKVVLPQDRKYNSGDAANQAFLIKSMTKEVLPIQKTDFTKVSGYGGVNSKNDFVGAVDWSKGHVPYIDGNGIGGDWSYLDGHAAAGEKPYVTWEVEGGQKVSFSFATQGSKYIDFYGSNIKVYTSATLDFAESSEYSLVNTEGNAYVCNLTVPENHKYVKVVLPQDRKYNSDDAANQAFLIKSMKVQTVGTKIEKTVKTVTGIKTVSNGTVTVIGDNVAAAGIVIEVTYADGEVRRTDCGYTYSGFDAENPNEQQITVSYKGFTDTATVVTLRSGDFNKDGKVDIRDYVRLKKIIVGQAESDGADPDLNGDGNVNATDLAIMRRFLIGAIASL